MRLMLDGRLAQTWTAIPGTVKSVDLDAMTCEVQPAIQGIVQDQSGAFSYVNYPLLVDVPIVFPSAGGFTITFPVASNDEVLVIFSSRCIDAWWQSGGIQRPIELRMHDLSDGFAIPGPKSQPNTIDSISTSDLQIRNDAGDVYISIGADKNVKLVSTSGKFAMSNTTTNLKTILTNLESALNTFMGTLAGFSGGVSPVTQAMLQAPAATAQTALATVLTEIGALLS